MKPKVAIQLFGHLRTFEVCAPALYENLIQVYDADVFIHTWDTLDHSSVSWHGLSDSASQQKVDSSVQQRIDELYSPKSILIESQNMFSELGVFGTHKDTGVSLEGMKYMLYSQYQVNLLRQRYCHVNNVTYDYVVVTRPDIFLNSMIDIANFSAEFSYYRKCSIHLINNPDLKLIANRYISYFRMADLLYVCTPEVCDILSEKFVNFEKYYKDINAILPDGVECPEVAFIEGNLQLGIVPRYYYNDFVIRRASGRVRTDLNIGASMMSVNTKVARATHIAASKLINFIVKLAPAPIRNMVLDLFLKLGNYARYQRALEVRERSADKQQE